MKYKCPCCDYFTFEEEPKGNYDICPVCFWEDDAIAYKYPDENLGCNGVSLREARENFKKFGACTEAMKSHVRAPKADEIH